MFVHIFNLFIIVLTQTIISDPICIYDVGNGLKLDIRTLGIANGKGPKYNQIPNIPPSTITFSWNGCFSYSKSGGGNCTNAAACYSNLIIPLYFIK
jgi:hypothetical protein